MIDTGQIRDHEAKALARSASTGMDAFYKDPENRKAFEEWKKKKGEKDKP